MIFPLRYKMNVQKQKADTTTRALRDNMSWEDVIKQREYNRQFRIQAKQLLKELAEIHHKLDELESEGAIDYQAVDKVEDAMTALRNEIKEMRQ